MLLWVIAQFKHEAVVSEAAAALAPTANSYGGADACNIHTKAFQDKYGGFLICNMLELLRDRHQQVSVLRGYAQRVQEKLWCCVECIKSHGMNAECGGISVWLWPYGTSMELKIPTALKEPMFLR